MMKKVPTILWLVLLFSCGRLPLQMAEEVYSPSLLHDMEYGVEMSLDPARFRMLPDRSQLEITNHTESTVQFGADYRIEYYDTEERKWIPFGPPEGTAFISIIYQLEPGKTETFSIDLFSDQIEYYQGSYRILKNFLIEGESYVFSAPFVLD